jgi:hypothetical protein
MAFGDVTRRAVVSHETREWCTDRSAALLEFATGWPRSLTSITANRQIHPPARVVDQHFLQVVPLLVVELTLFCEERANAEILDAVPSFVELGFRDAPAARVADRAVVLASVLRAKRARPVASLDGKPRDADHDDRCRDDDSYDH